ncbi:MAG: matrixin family metalloprotease [Phycisphaeraceae bacterium]|nr:MAG: matrixin family metalloprotease [Phycisphaeraceae bacterium]
MKNRCACLLSAAAGIVVSAGVATAASAAVAAPDGIASPDELAIRQLATAMLPAMPADQQRAIIAAGGIGSQAYHADIDQSGEVLVENDARYQRLRGFVSPALFARVKDVYLDSMLASLDRAAKGEPPISFCFAEGTDPDLVDAYTALFQNEFWGGPDNGDRFQTSNRWSATATDGFGTGSMGDPITLTYSFAPDGSLAANLSNQLRSSQLFAWLNGLYGSTATWQSLFAQVFARWETLTGVNYVYEPNDDGVTANTQSGSLGVRGDVRIFAVTLDGGGGVLAYNQFPNQGDMVIDAFDSFFSSTSQNSRRLRNVVAHEHGHGLGFAHVCPANGTKLMEPFVSTGYDGPQLDDILAGQRFYGDPNEINDTAGTATDVGSFFIGHSTAVENMSIDDNSDVDFYRFTTTQPLQIVVDVEPDAGIYQQGPQTSQCNSGTLTDYTTKQDLTVAIRASNGSTTLLLVNDTAAGSPEHLEYTLNTPGTYYIVVDDATAQNSIQRYRMDIAGDTVPFNGPTIVAQQSEPTVVAPGTPVTLDFQVLANEDTIIDGPDLHYRMGGGAYTTVAMTSLGSNLYRASIPAASCGDTPEYYLSVVGSFVGEVDLPVAGASAPFAFDVGELTTSFSDNFETSTGWNTAVHTASAGWWERGVPVASTGAPPSDYDGSGQCYVTGNSADEDVDFGLVMLISPAVDLDAGGRFSYAYWYSNGGGAFDASDYFHVDMSTDGGILWTTMRTYTTDSGGWQTDTIDVDAATGVVGTRFRFVVNDGGNNNTVEGAVDAVTVGQVTCSEPQGCNPADIAEPYNVLDLQDISAFISAFLGGDPLADIAEPFGVLDLQDIQAFTTNFVAGCP